MPSYSAVLFSPSPSYEGEKQNCVDQIYRKNLTLPTSAYLHCRGSASPHLHRHPPRTFRDICTASALDRKHPHQCAVASIGHEPAISPDVLEKKLVCRLLAFPSFFVLGWFRLLQDFGLFVNRIGDNSDRLLRTSMDASAATDAAFWFDLR